MRVPLVVGRTVYTNAGIGKVRVIGAVEPELVFVAVRQMRKNDLPVARRGNDGARGKGSTCY